jgi:NAD(P)-dependent dehydrogenase (short-subunit alcohol dehydrogenase family)
MDGASKRHALVTGGGIGLAIAATFAATAANPQARLVRPLEVAAAAAWLASDAAGSVTGQAIAIDGGETVS